VPLPLAKVARKVRAMLSALQVENIYLHREIHLPRIPTLAISLALFYRLSLRMVIAMDSLPITPSVARRRAAIGLLAAAATLFITLAVGHSRAASEVDRPVVARGRTQQIATLRERLIYGLAARIPVELEFVDAVVLEVRLGRLPQRMVDQTFFWARDRASIAQNGSQERPIIFFQPAMRIRAARLKVKLPMGSS
jgi:hypothetical protein